MTSEQESHPIVLGSLVFTKCLVHAVPGHDLVEEKESLSPSNNIEIKPVPDQVGHWAAVMRTVINPEEDPKWPYHIEMECAALLLCDNTLDEQTAQRGVLITAHSVLYGAIRETVGWLTGRQPYGPLLLGLSVLRPPPAPAAKAPA